MSFQTAREPLRPTAPTKAKHTCLEAKVNHHCLESTTMVCGMHSVWSAGHYGLPTGECTPTWSQWNNGRAQLYYICTCKIMQKSCLRYSDKHPLNFPRSMFRMESSPNNAQLLLPTVPCWDLCSTLGHLCSELVLGDLFKEERCGHLKQTSISKQHAGRNIQNI